MTAVNIKAFRGQIPRVSERLLQPNNAARALNCKITAGSLDPLAGLEQVYDANRSVETIYRYRAFRSGVFEDNWLTWAEDVNVVPSPNANDPFGRFYFSSESYEPRMSSYDLAINTVPYPTAWYALGTAAPTVAPTVAHTGGSSTTESRSYVYTYVTAFGEESPPSPPSTLYTTHINATWNITGMQTAPPNTGTITAATSISSDVVRVTLNTVFGIAQFDTLTFASVGGMTSLNGSFRVQSVNTATNQITVALTTAQTYTSGGTWTRNAAFNTTGMVKRIYRTVGTGGTFLFVAEIPVATTSYADTVVAANLGEELPTADSSPPPKNLVSLISLPNGCLAGIAGNELCFSDPYMPYSWPIRNRYAFSGVGVAAIAASNSVIVLTETFPILYTGSDPEAMSGSTLETYAPCVAKRGVVDIGGGALYPSFDGLWLVSTQQVQCITRKLYREEEWSRLNPATFDAVFHDGQYYAYYEGQDNTRIVVLDVNTPDSVVEVDEVADALYRNELDGKLYVAKGEILYEWDVDSGRYYESDWQSVDMQFPSPVKFAAVQIHADFGALVPVDTSQLTANEALIALGPDAVAGHLNGMELLSTEINGSFIVPVELDTERRVQFTLYDNEVPVYTKNVTSAKFFRLPAGFSSEVYAVGLSSSVKVYSVTVAESVAELSQTSA
jgi:hypothetical protein